MKKFIGIIKEKDIDIYLILTIIISSLIQISILWVSDDLWNFANIYKMHIGFTIYKDINVIITPLFYVIGLLFFKVFGANFFVFNTYGVIMYLVFFAVINLIFKELKIKKTRRLFFILLLIVVQITSIPNAANYNILAITSLLISTLLLIKNNKNYYIHAILIFITFLCKQNIGVYHGIGILIYILLENNEYKTKIKNIFKVGISDTILLSLFALILYKFNILYDFINYTILGMREFTNKNIGTGGKMCIMLILSEIVLVIFLIIVCKNKKIKNTNGMEEVKKNLKILLALGIPQMLNMAPIFNEYHISLGANLILIASMYVMERMVIEDALKDKFKKAEIIIVVLTSIILLGFITYQKYKVIKEYSVFVDKKDSPYYTKLAAPKTLSKIENVVNYIKTNEKDGIEVKMLSMDADLYMVLLNESNGEFDLPFLGNLGREGEDGLIQKICNLQNNKLLIKTKDNDFWQESKKVKEYIRENFEKIGEIEEYSIYQIN